MSKKITLAGIVEAIKHISQNLAKPVEKVTLKDLQDHGVAERQVRNNGGLAKIKKANFPEMEKDLKTITKLTAEVNYTSKLEKQLGNKLLLEDTILEIIKSNIKPLPKIKTPKLKGKKKASEPVEIVGMLNDTHIGLIVDPDEIGQINSFDFKEACRRFAFYGKQLGDYKKHKRDQVTKLNLVLNGDLLAGLIHGLETKGIHLMVHQVNAAVHIFTHLISYLAQEYNSIEVHGIAGNHDRAIHKDGGKRPVSEVYDSYANIIFYALSTAFRNSKQITFNFPKTAYGFINLPAGRAMYAHGDHIFSSALGNPGKSINIKGMTDAVRLFNAGEISKGIAPIKLLLLGHVHTYAHFITSDGVEVYVSPSLVGLDAFAHSLTINNNFMAQPIFESTPNFILGDSRLIRLNTADADEELDKIIPVYSKELKWGK